MIAIPSIKTAYIRVKLRNKWPTKVAKTLTPTPDPPHGFIPRIEHTRHNNKPRHNCALRQRQKRPHSCKRCKTLRRSMAQQQYRPQEDVHREHFGDGEALQSEVLRELGGEVEDIEYCPELVVLVLCEMCVLAAHRLEVHAVSIVNEHTGDRGLHFDQARSCLHIGGERSLHDR